ncbi:MAG: HEAT repeat domain-containing protein [Promethearchaeota archaeon]
MPKKRSPAWELFMYEFFERSAYLQWHDGITPEVVLYLKGEELVEAEDMLIDSVKKGDMWPTKGLAVMKSKKAIPVLKEMFKKSPLILQIRIADALEAIEGKGEQIPFLIDCLHGKGSGYERLEVAIALRKYPSEQTIDALYKGILDENYLIRYHCAESLLFIHDIKTGISSLPEIFHFICSKQDSVSKGEDPKQMHKIALKKLKELFKNQKNDARD